MLYSFQLCKLQLCRVFSLSGVCRLAYLQQTYNSLTTYGLDP